MEILKVENLCKVYGTGEARVQALKQVSFSMERGEFGAVVGVSGSGKSTLLNCIGGLDEANAGKVFLGGKDIFAMGEEERTIFRRQNIGFIFQSFHLIPELDVEQNITFPLLLDYKKPDQERVDELLEVLGLADRRKHLPGQLSGGQQQRVAIGRALMNAPQVMLADEPTGSLDSRNGKEIIYLLKKSNRLYGQTLLLVTHDENIALQADRIITIADGKVVRDERQVGRS